MEELEEDDDDDNAAKKFIKYGITPPSSKESTYLRHEPILTQGVGERVFNTYNYEDEYTDYEDGNNFGKNNNKLNKIHKQQQSNDPFKGGRPQHREQFHDAAQYGHTYGDDNGNTITRGHSYPYSSKYRSPPRQHQNFYVDDEYVIEDDDNPYQREKQAHQHRHHPQHNHQYSNSYEDSEYIDEDDGQQQYNKGKHNHNQHSGHDDIMYVDEEDDSIQYHRPKQHHGYNRQPSKSSHEDDSDYIDEDEEQAYSKYKQQGKKGRQRPSSPHYFRQKKKKGFKEGKNNYYESKPNNYYSTEPEIITGRPLGHGSRDQPNSQHEELNYDDEGDHSSGETLAPYLDQKSPNQDHYKESGGKPHSHYGGHDGHRSGEEHVNHHEDMQDHDYDYEGENDEDHGRYNHDHETPNYNHGYPFDDEDQNPHIITNSEYTETIADQKPTPLYTHEDMHVRVDPNERHNMKPHDDDDHDYDYGETPHYQSKPEAPPPKYSEYEDLSDHEEEDDDYEAYTDDNSWHDYFDSHRNGIDRDINTISDSTESYKAPKRSRSSGRS